jgi:RimJ/RimL family protein N-acetyltransferase
MNPLLLDIPTEFSSERLFFRPYRPTDGSMYFEMLTANREHLHEFMPQNLTDVKSVQDVERVFRWHQTEWNSRHLFIFGVWEKETGAYVGESYLANADWNVPRIEVGYFIVQASTRKGFATEAARTTVRFAFDHLGVVRVELQCTADNVGSIKVAENCGFVYEGRFRERHRKKSGLLVDVLWYGMLLSDWQNSLGSQTGY